MKKTFYKLVFTVLFIIASTVAFAQSTVTFTGVAPTNDYQYIGSQNLDVAVNSKTLRFHYNNANNSGAQGGPNYYMAPDGSGMNDGTGVNQNNRGLIVNEQNSTDALTISYTDNSAFSFNSFKVIDFNLLFDTLYPGAGGPANPLTITGFNGATQVASISFTYVYNAADYRNLVNTLSAAPAFSNVTSVIITSSNGFGFYNMFDDVVVGAAAPVISILPTTLTSAMVSTAYSRTITASGGTAPYTYAVTAGVLPSGLSLSLAGVLSGKATAGGTFNFTVRATDAASFTGSRAYTLNVSAPSMNITPALFPAATKGVAYSQTATGSGGTAPYTFISIGSLPAGLTLSSAGVFSGTPTVSGTFSVRFQITDSSTGTGPYSISRTYPSFVVNGPTITAGGGPLTAMSTTYGSASTPAQSFTVSGTSLTAGILITPADAAFEVSKDNGISYSSAVTLAMTAGTVSTTTIMTRLAATAAAGTHSGNIVLSSSGATSVNVATASSLVSPAPLTITANNQTKVYGAAVPTLTANYTGFVNGDNSASLTSQPALTTTATSASSVSGGPYSITASGAVGSNYTIGYVAGSLSVTSAPLTVTADDQAKIYGAALPTLTASYTGFVNGDTQASLTTQPTLTTTATSASTVSGGPYPITASGAVDADYSISYVAGSLSVTTAPLTITADNQTKIYGAALPTLTASYTGFVNGDNSASLTTQPMLTTTATAASTVSGGSYSITASGAVDADYSISYVAGSLSVTTAPLTITADDQTKIYGAALPTLTASYTGFVNGDTQASLTTPATLTTTATSASTVSGGPYPITASGAVDADYSISYVTGSLSVTTAPLTITADDQTKIYGAALPTLTASYTGFVNGNTQASLTTQPTLSTTATAASSVAGSPYPITPSGAVDADYSISYVAGSLSVTTAPLTITADDQNSIAGQALPTLTASYNGFVNGDTAGSLTTQPTVTTTGTSSSPVGPYPITVSGATDTDYTISYVAGTLTITASTDATLANLAISSGTLTPSFATGTTSYTAIVSSGTTSITVTPTTTDANATIKVNGTTVASGAASGAISLNVGNNVITTIVTAQDGSTIDTYTVTVTRPSNDARLSLLQVNTRTVLTAVSGPADENYTTTVGFATSSIIITPVAENANAAIMINGTPIASGTASSPIALNPGQTTINLSVTAQDGVTIHTLTLIVNRTGSSNAKIIVLQLSPSATLTATSGSANENYAAAVANAVNTITVTPVASDANASITVNGSPVISGTASNPIVLNAGSNTISLVVTAQDGSTTRTFSVTVTRAGSNNDRLSTLRVSTGTTLSPSSGPGDENYITSVDFATTSLSLIATAIDANASISVNGTPVASGTASGLIALNPGPTIITAIVTAQDGITTRNYTVTVNRTGSSNAKLNLLSINSGTPLIPVTGSNGKNYTTTVPSSVTAIAVTPTTANANATVTVNGSTVVSGTASNSIALSPGTNTITTIVTAQDGSTTVTYIITVTQSGGFIPGYATYQSQSVNPEAVMLQLATDDGIMVHQAISPNGDGINDYLLIEGLGAYPDNKLMIMNRSGQKVFETQGYDNISKVFNGHSNVNGAMQLPGTYFYSLEYRSGTEIKHKTGYIILKY